MDTSVDEPVLIKSDFIQVVSETKVRCSLCDLTINSSRIYKHRQARGHRLLEADLKEARLRLWIARKLAST
jgi:hypothetical protein